MKLRSLIQLVKLTNYFCRVKPIIKAKISGKLVTSGIRDVATTSVRENLSEEVDYE